MVTHTYLGVKLQVVKEGRDHAGVADDHGDLLEQVLEGQHLLRVVAGRRAAHVPEGLPRGGGVGGSVCMCVCGYCVARGKRKSGLGYVTVAGR
jgi:hypothetical protein